MKRPQRDPVRVRFASMVAALLGLFPGAWADVVTTTKGETNQGTVTFREGDALEVASGSGEKVRIALADLASLDLTPGDQQWRIGGTGVLTTNGSFLARAAVKMDGKVVTFAQQDETLLLTRQNTTALFFQPLRSRDAEVLRFDRQGVFLRDGDFMEGRVVGLAEGRVTVESLLLGRKSFSVETEAMAVVLRAPVTGALEGWSLFLADGSRLRCREILLTEGGVILPHSPYRDFRIGRDELSGIRKESAQPLMELFRTRWLSLEPERPLAAAALGEKATTAEFAGALAGMSEERTRREAVKNEAKAEWIRAQQIATRLKAGAARGVANVARMEGQVKEKARRVEQDERMVQRAAEDIERKMEAVKQAEQKIEETRKRRDAIPREDATQRRNWEQQVRNAERLKQNAERIVNQARAIRRRHETRVKATLRLVHTAEERVAQAKAQKEKDDAASEEAVAALGTAKASYDLATADLREVGEELRRLEFLIQQRKDAEKK
ncbi:MAG: hypothetical protein CMN05_04460 [Roseibacillus sp.]|nr:hypothetical protein [Roseibacillus sp.]